MYLFQPTDKIYVSGSTNHILVQTVTDFTTNTPISTYKFRKNEVSIQEYPIKATTGEAGVLFSLKEDNEEIGFYVNQFDPENYEVPNDVRALLNSIVDSMDVVSAQVSGTVDVDVQNKVALEKTPLREVTATISIPGAKAYSQYDELSNANSPSTPTPLQLSGVVPSNGGKGIIRAVKLVATRNELVIPVQVQVYNSSTVIPNTDGNVFEFGNNTTSFISNINMPAFETGTTGSTKTFTYIDGLNNEFECGSAQTSLYLRFMALAANATVGAGFDIEVTFYIEELD